MPPAIFLVTGLHTKRRPSDQTTIERAQVGKHQALPLQAPHRDLMGTSAHKTTTDEGNDANQTKPIRPPAGKFKFVPKPLILVERMKVRRRILGSPSTSALRLHADTPGDTEPRKDIPGSLSQPAAATTTNLTPTNHTTPGPRRSSHSTSARYNLRNDAVAPFRGGFGILREDRLSSTVISDLSPSSTDTFVDNSPSCTKWSSKVQLLTEVLPGSEVAELDRPRISNFGLKAFVTSVLGRTFQLADTFGPAMTSTPLTSSRTGTTNPSTSIAYSPFPLNETPGLPDDFAIPSPTSRVGYSFNAAPDSYIVKLPKTRSIVSLSRLNRMSIVSTASTAVSYSESWSDSCETIQASPSKAILDSGRSLNRVMSPTLVLDGVFAIPRALSLVSPAKSTHRFPPTHKLTPRLHPPFSDATNTTPSTPPPAATISGAASRHGSDSPRSRLARVLSMSASQNVDMCGEPMIPRVRKSYVPPLATDLKASIDPVTQNEIEALRAHGRVSANPGSRTLDSFLELAPVGRVAKLREKWERGSVGLGE